MCLFYAQGMQYMNIHDIVPRLSVTINWVEMWISLRSTRQQQLQLDVVYRTMYDACRPTVAT